MQPELVEALAGEVAMLIKTALGPVLERMAAIDAHLARWPAHEQSLGDLRDHLIRVETKAVAPAPIDVTPMLERLAAIDARLDDVDKYATRVEGYTACLQRDAAALSERVAVVETRAPVPGPAGADGIHGKDGADGLGFEDLAVEFDGDRTVAFRFDRAGVSKVFPLVLPFLRYEGVYQQGKAYDVGDTVTWAGAMWHCQEATITKPGESAAWKLCVNRGRDGKAGKDSGEGPAALPVVSVGKR